jgi:hypothetical protein
MADNSELVNALQKVLEAVSPADTSAALLSSLLNTNNILSLLVLKTGAPESVSARLASVASTNATLVKAKPAKVYRILAYNSNASARYLKLYNKITAPVVGTDVPLVTIVIPPSALYSQTFDVPISLSVGLAYAMTGGVADTDTTAITANDIQGVLLYV